MKFGENDFRGMPLEELGKLRDDVVQGLSESIEADRLNPNAPPTRSMREIFRGREDLQELATRLMVSWLIENGREGRLPALTVG